MVIKERFNAKMDGDSNSKWRTTGGGEVIVVDGRNPQLREMIVVYLRLASGEI